MVSKIIILLLLGLYSCSGNFGKCAVKNPNVVSNFEIEKYLGAWYEQVRDVSVPFQKGECTKAEYTADGNFIKVVNSEYRDSENKRIYAEAKGFYPNPPVAKLLINFGPNFLEYFKFALGTYWVLDTDYVNYAIVYSCKEIFGLYSTEFIWILTREKVYPEDKLQVLINYIVEVVGYPKDRIRIRTRQGDECIY